MPLPVILIFDIGKTNKKALLFDNQYKLVYEESKQLPETCDEDGFPCEDVHLLTDWIEQTFQKIHRDAYFKIAAINVSAYGASFVHLDDKMQPFLPLYNYLKPYPEDLRKEFYKTYDTNGTLALETSSPVLGHLNSGMQLYWLRHTKPEVYKRIKYSLHLPQYVIFILSGMIYTDITSVGCHTNLWNFQQDDYHSWVYEENIIDKFPSVIASNEISHIKNNTIAVGAGLHDSSAALIPYLEIFDEPFILLSTGTWSISLNPFNHTALTSGELANDCLCYLSYHGSPVKASRLFAGNEHEQRVKRFAAHYNTSTDYYKMVTYDVSICNKLQRIKPQNDTNSNSAMMGESYFSRRNLDDFETYEEAYHQLMLDIMAQQVQSTKMVMQGISTKKIFVDGGFSKNDVYMNLLAAAFPQTEVYSAKVAQASALGAAMAMRKVWNDDFNSAGLITVKLYQPAYNKVL